MASGGAREGAGRKKLDANKKKLNKTFRIDPKLFKEIESKYPNEKFRIIKDPSIATEQLAWGVKKGNTELLNKLNNGLAQLKADGTYNKIHEKWFGKIQ